MKLVNCLSSACHIQVRNSVDISTGFNRIRVVDLVLLIKKLMKLVFTAQDQGRERTIYIALISKALLEPHWASDSPMIYLDLIRYFNSLCILSLTSVV